MDMGRDSERDTWQPQPLLGLCSEVTEVGLVSKVWGSGKECKSEGGGSLEQDPWTEVGGRKQLVRTRQQAGPLGEDDGGLLSRDSGRTVLSRMRLSKKEMEVETEACTAQGGGDKGAGWGPGKLA